LHNHCEEKTDIDGSKYMYVEGRYLNSDGKALGEATISIKIPIFRRAKKIQHLPVYPLQYHAAKETVRRELIRCSREFVSLMGIYHRHYEEKVFFINEKGVIVGRCVKGRIVVDAIGFQKCKPDYPYLRIYKVAKRYVWGPLSDAAAQIKLEDVRPDQLEDRDFFICSPTVFGFSLESKAFYTFIFSIGYDSCYQLQWSLLLPISERLNGISLRLTMSKS